MFVGDIKTEQEFKEWILCGYGCIIRCTIIQLNSNKEYYKNLTCDEKTKFVCELENFRLMVIRFHNHKIYITYEGLGFTAFLFQKNYLDKKEVMYLLSEELKVIESQPETFLNRINLDYFPNYRAVLS